jgi:hypothetical protein
MEDFAYPDETIEEFFNGWLEDATDKYSEVLIQPQGSVDAGVISVELNEKLFRLKID